jgi:hypothetical protein
MASFAELARVTYDPKKQGANAKAVRRLNDELLARGQGVPRRELERRIADAMRGKIAIR